MASGSVEEVFPDTSEEERKLIEAFKALKAKRKLDTESLIKMLETSEDRDVKFEDQDWKDFAAESQTSRHRLSSMTLENDMPLRSAKFTYPKLLKFFGEEGKGEATWQKFKYDLVELMKENIYTDEQLMFGIRQAMMGKAGKILIRMGSGMTAQKVLDKFESEVGFVDSIETVLGKLFNCKQGEKETVLDYAARVEDLYLRVTMTGDVPQGRQGKLL